MIKKLHADLAFAPVLHYGLIKMDDRRLRRFYDVLSEINSYFEAILVRMRESV